MEQYIPFAVAAAAAFLVWKIFAGIVKFLLLAAIIGGIGYAWWQGLIG